jgi:hypothetical protein
VNISDVLRGQSRRKTILEAVMEKVVEKSIGELEKRIEELEADVRCLTYVNVELTQAVNSKKHKQLLNALLKQASKVVK